MNKKQLCGIGDEFDATFFVILVVLNIVVVIVVILVVIISDVFPQLILVTNIRNGIALFLSKWNVFSSFHPENPENVNEALLEDNFLRIESKNVMVPLLEDSFMRIENESVKVALLEGEFYKN